MEVGNIRYKPRCSILDLPSGLFDKIVSVLDAGPESKNWRSFINVTNHEFRLSQLEIEQIARAASSSSSSPGRQTLLKLESLGLTTGQLVFYLDKLRLETLLLYLKKYEPIRILSSPSQSLHLTAGDLLQLTVTATGFPYPRYQWFNGDTPIEGATENTLTISTVRESDNGSYCCRLHNSADLDLCVFSDPTEITVSPAPVDVSSSQQITLTSRNFGQKVIINDDYLHYDTNIRKVRPLQAACDTISEEFHDQKEGRPYIVCQPQSVCVEEGQRLLMKCQASGEPMIKYRWFFNGHILQDSPHGVLEIDQAKETDSGQYQCIVCNNYGHTQSDQADVTVIATQSDGEVKQQYQSLVPLDIISQPKSTIVGAGGCALFRCGAVGLPPLNYQWYKDCKPIPGESRSDLMLSDVSHVSEACYQCRVWTHHDEVLSCGAYLTVTDSAFPTDGTMYTATDKVALLIGNYDYRGAGPLKAPKTDVHVLSECFRSMNFKVVSLLNMTRGEMIAAVGEFCELLSDHKSHGSGVYAVFYFCGHGFQDHHKQCYLVPVDAPTAFSSSDCVCAEYVLEQVQETKPGLCCVILDCCRTLNDIPPDKSEPMYYPQPHGNTVFFYATTFGMRAFEYERDDDGVQSLPCEELNGILVKHLQANLCKKQSVMSVFSATQEAISADLKLRSCQIPEVRSNLSEPRRSLADKVVFQGHTDVYSQRNLRWLSAHKKPAKSHILIDEIEAVIEVDYQSDFSNVLTVYLTVKDKGTTLECQPWVTKLPLNLDVMGHPKIVTYNPLTTKTVIQDLQKLQEPLMLTVGVYYRMEGVTGSHPGKTLDLGRPLVSVLDLWRVAEDVTCTPLHPKDGDSLPSMASHADRDVPCDLTKRGGFGD